MAFVGIAALAAAASAGTAITVTMVLVAVAEVGMILTVVGALTGSEDLMKIGSIMSLVGGVGGLVAGATSGAAGAAGAAAEGALSEAATEAALQTASEQAAGAAGGSAAADAATMEVVAGMEGAASSGADLAANAAAQPSSIVGNAMQTPGTELAQAVQQPQMQVGPSSTDVMTPTGPQGPAGATSPTGPQGPSSPFDNPTDMRLASGTQNAPMSSESFFNKFTSVAKDNSTLFNGGMQLLGGAMKGMNDRSMWNEKMDLERENLALRSFGSQTAEFARRPKGIVGGATA